MLKISRETQKKYSELLLKNSVPQNRHGYYNKWLRRYLDYCGKYNHSHSDPASLKFFEN